MQEQWRRNAYILWVAVILHGIAWSAIIPYMPVYMEADLGVSGAKAWAGAQTATFAFCGAIVGPIWGALGDRYGRKRFMVQAGVVMALTYVLMIFATSPLELLAIRFLNGVFSGFAAISLAIVAVNTPQAHLGIAMSMQQTAFPSGLLLGPFLGGIVYDLYGMRWAMGLSAVLICIGAMLAALFIKENPIAPVKAKAGIGLNLATDMKAAAAYPGLLKVLLISVVARAAIAAVEPVFVPFVKELALPGTPNWVAGAVFSLGGVAFILGVRWWARLSQRIGYVRTLSIGLAGAAILQVLQGVSRTPYELAAFRLSGGIMEAAILPGVVALLATSVPLQMRGAAFGLNLSATHIGQVLGPLTGGFIGAFVGSRYVFYFAALGMAFGYIWVKRTINGSQGFGETS